MILLHFLLHPCVMNRGPGRNSKGGNKYRNSKLGVIYIKDHSTFDVVADSDGTDAANG